MEDLANYPGLTRRGNIWYARKRVPKDIADMYKSDSVKYSPKTDTLEEAKKLYHIKMLEIQSDFDQKRKERDHKKETDQLSKFNEASLLGIAFEWYRETQGKIDSSKTKDIGTQYSEEEIYDATASTGLQKQNYHEALQSNNFEIIYPTAQRWLDKKSITYDVKSKAYDLFCYYLRLPQLPHTTPVPFDKWVVSSGLQKSIRRGQVDIALNCAGSLWQMDRQMLWWRICVTALEDIGIGDIGTVSEALAICSNWKWRRRVGDLFHYRGFNQQPNYPAALLESLLP